MLKLNTKSLIRGFCVLLALFLMQGFQVPTVHAGTITEVVVFGDSLSDTGNLFNFQQEIDYPPLPPSPPYFPGRFSNGFLWVEWLALGLKVPIPTPNRLDGTNYAWGGAETGPGTSARGTPNIGEQIETFLDENTPTDNQLFVIWGGANDFNNAATLPNPADLVDNIVGHIRAIANAAPGTNLKFLVPNLPPLGRTPRVLWLGLHLNPDIPPLLDMLSASFNDILSAALKDLAGELEITILQLDIFSLAEEILRSPAAFGFTNVEDTARIGDDPLGRPPDFLSPGTEVVPNADDYLFFDDVHPTRVWHQIAGIRALKLVAKRFPERTHFLRHHAIESPRHHSSM